jgi:hypothetical protein
MNFRALRRHVCLGLMVTILTVWVSGCTGAGPAASGGGSRPRCGSASSDEQRPLFFIFCVESP